MFKVSVSPYSPQPETLRGLVRSLRNAVANFHIRPIHENRQVKGFTFESDGGLQATISLAELRVFVERLAQHIERVSNA